MVTGNAHRNQDREVTPIYSKVQAWDFFRNLLISGNFLLNIFRISRKFLHLSISCLTYLKYNFLSFFAYLVPTPSVSVFKHWLVGTKPILWYAYFCFYFQLRFSQYSVKPKPLHSWIYKLDPCLLVQSLYIHGYNIYGTLAVSK